MKMKEDLARGLSIISHKTDLILSHVGHKVIPESDVTTSFTKSVDRERKGDKDQGNDTHHKAKAIVRMKELLKKAVAAKSEKASKYFDRKILYLRNKGMLRSVPDDDQLSTESPKISFRWDTETHSTTTSACLSRASSSFTNTNMPTKFSIDCSVTDLIQDTNYYHKPGSWITTDSEFVVLEL